MRHAVIAVALAAAASASADRPAPVTAYLDVTVRWQRGRITVEKVERGRYDKPTALKRWTGRFEARVRGGGKVLDTVRFDIPLLGEADAGTQGKLAEKLQANVSAVTRVRVPLPEGVEAVEIADRRGGPAVAVPMASPDGGTSR